MIMLKRIFNIGFHLAFSLTALFCSSESRAAPPEGFSILADRSGVTAPAPITPGAQSSPWVPTAADSARGFAVYVADGLTNLTPEWAWSESSPKNRIDTFACAGQYKSVALAVRTLQNVSQLQPSCSDLRSAADGNINAENIDIRMVQYLPTEFDGKIFPGKGRWLEKAFPANLQANWTAWLWVTFYVPQNTPVGLYLGNLTVADGSGKTAVLTIQLTVLDISLQRPPGSWGMLVPGHFSGSTVGIYENYALSDQWKSQNLALYSKFCKAHGFNSLALYGVYPSLKCVNSSPVTYFSAVRTFANAMKTNGMTGDLYIDLRWVIFWAGPASQKIITLQNQGQPIVGDLGIYGYDGSEDATLAFNDVAKRLFRETTTQLRNMAIAESWPQIRLMVEEELWTPSLKTQTYDQYMPELLTVAREEAFLIDNTVAYPPNNGDIPIDRGHRDNLRVREYNNWDEQALSDARADGAQIRSYNMAPYRATWGLYQQRIGSTGHHQWADQWGQRAGHDTDDVWTYSRITSLGMVSSVEMERSREGLDDLAYFKTLESLAAQLDQAGLGANAAAARQVLTNISSPVPIERYQYFNWQKTQSESQLDQYRWQVVQAIQTARIALGQTVQAPPVYSNLCDELMQWRDNNSGTMSIQSGGLSGSYVRFQTNIIGSTITLHPNVDSGTSGVTVHADDKLVFDTKGIATDFSVNLTINGTWYNLTGVSGNPWIYLGAEWRHFELTIPVDGLADNLCFNVYAPGQVASIDNVLITSNPPALAATPTFAPENTMIYTSTPVTITSATSNAVIRYTTDGSEPTVMSPLYTGPITIGNQTTLRSRSFAPGYAASAIKSVTYTFYPGYGLAGDANGDGAVDVGDLGILAANYGQSGKTWPQGDFNSDGMVDVGDLGILAAHYGEGATQPTNFSDDYARAFGSTVTDDAENSSISNLGCPALGLPLVVGLLLAALCLCGLKL
jgi:hypothetical protein